MSPGLTKRKLHPLGKNEATASTRRSSGSWRLFNRALGVFGALALWSAPAHAVIDVNNSFSPGTIYPNEVSRLTILLQNSAFQPVTNVAFTNLLNENVFITGTPNPVTTCGGSISFANAATHGEFSLSGGGIPASDGTNPGVCSVSINVTATQKATYVSTIPAGAVTGVTNGVADHNSQATDATLAVIAQEATIAVVFNNTPSATYLYLQGGEQGLYTIRIANPNRTPLTGVSLPYNMGGLGHANVVAIPGTVSTTCGPVGGPQTVTLADAPNSTILAPRSLITLTDGVIPANSSCDVTFSVTTGRPIAESMLISNHSLTVPALLMTSNEGVSNLVAPAPKYTYVGTGVAVDKTFSGLKTDSIYLSEGSVTELRLSVSTYNLAPVTNFTLADVLPASGSGQMSFQSVVSNSCGGSVVGAPGATSFTLTGATLAGNLDQVSGVQTMTCELRVLVGVSGVGTYSNQIPDGALSGYKFMGGSGSNIRTRAILYVSDSPPVAAPLVVSHTLTNPVSSVIYPGDRLNAIFTFANNSATATVTNLRLTNALTTMGVGFRVAQTGVYLNTCDSVPMAAPDATSVYFVIASLPPSSSCQIGFHIKSAADAWPKLALTTSRTSYNEVPVGNILYDRGSSTNNVYSSVVQAAFSINRALTLVKTFTPAIVAPLGVTRLRITPTRATLDRNSTSGLTVVDHLPAGHVVAPDPAVFNTCGGSVAAVPGAGTLSLQNGAMGNANASSHSCYFEVNVRAPALTPPSLSAVATNTIPGTTHDALLNNTPAAAQLRAIDDSQPAPYNALEGYSAAAANLTRRATTVTSNKEFLPQAIAGGGVARVRILFSNVEPTAIALSGVGLTDDFTGSDLRLHSNVNATFTDTNGVPNANGCTGGVFTGAPGAQSITLSKAAIGAGSTCRFEFNITAHRGGNHVNVIRAGDLQTMEGVSNPADVLATLTVARNVQVGKGFAPSAIALGEQSIVTLDIYNTNEPGVNEQGASLALRDVLPAGLAIAGPVTNSCGGTSSSGIVSGGAEAGRHYIALSGGTFIATQVCHVRAPVTAAATGIYTNDVAAGDLKTVSGSTNPDPASASLRVIAPPTITKTFGTAGILAGGVSQVTLRVANPNAAALLPTGFTGVRIRDLLVNMRVAPNATVAGTCGATHNAAPNATDLTFSGFAIAPGGTCTIIFSVTSNTQGLHPNQTTGASTDQLVNPGPASNTVNLAVNLPLILTKAFDRAQMTPNGVARVTLTIQNPNAAAVGLATSSAINDYFPTTPGPMVLASPVGVTTQCSILARTTGGAASIPAGAASIRFQAGTIPANGTCVVGFNVTASEVGFYENVTSPLATTTAGESPAAQAVLEVVPLDPRFTVTKEVDRTGPVSTPGALLSYTIRVVNTGNVALTNVTPVDRLNGQLLSLTGPVETGAVGGTAGVLDVGETWRYTASYSVTQANLNSGAPLVNSVTVSARPPSGDPIQSPPATATTRLALIPGPLSCASGAPIEGLDALTAWSGTEAQLAFGAAQGPLRVQNLGSSGFSGTAWPGVGPSGGRALSVTSGAGARISIDLGRTVSAMRLELRGLDGGANHQERLRVSALRNGASVPVHIVGGSSVGVAIPEATGLAASPSMGDEGAVYILISQPVDALRLDLEALGASPPPVSAALTSITACAPRVDAALTLTPNHESTVPAGQLAIYRHEAVLGEALAGGLLDFLTTSDQGLEWAVHLDAVDPLTGAPDGVFGAGDPLVPPGAQLPATGAGTLGF